MGTRVAGGGASLREKLIWKELTGLTHGVIYTSLLNSESRFSVKKAYFASLCLTLAAVSISAALADDSVTLAGLPDGSSFTLSIPSSLIHAYSNNLDLGTVQVSPADQVACAMGFNASDKDRTIQGQLSASLKQAQYYGNGTYVLSADSSGFLLDGKEVPVSLTCYVSSTTDNKYMTIGELRTYLENKGGSLTVAPPVPFGG